MSRRSNTEPLTKVTLNLFSKDYERLQAMYPQVGATVAIRALVRQHVNRVEAKTSAMIDDSGLDIELEDEDVGQNS